MKLSKLTKSALTVLLTLSLAGTALAVSATVTIHYFQNVDSEEIAWELVNDPQHFVGQGNVRDRVVTFDGYIGGKRTIIQEFEMQPYDIVFPWTHVVLMATFEGRGVVTMVSDLTPGDIAGQILHRFEPRRSFLWWGTKWTHDYTDLRSEDASIPDEAVHAVHNSVIIRNVSALAAELALR